MFVALGLVAAATARAADRQAPVLRQQPCRAYRPGLPFEIVVLIEDQSDLFDPKVIYRSPPGTKWRNLSLVADADGKTHRAVVPAAHLVGTLEYFVEAFDILGNGPGQLGNMDHPFVVNRDEAAEPCVVPATTDSPAFPPATPPPANPLVDVKLVAPSAKAPTEAPNPPPAPGICDGPDVPFYCEPWVWAVWGGVVVVSAVTVVVIVATGGKPSPESVDLEVTAVSPNAQ
jgi:hypothetical protein